MKKVVMGVLALTFVLQSAQPIHAATTLNEINNFSRSAVVDSYLRFLKPALVLPVEWTGNALECKAGETSLRNKRDVLATLNYARALADLPPVKINLKLSQYAQASALISRANALLTHTPSKQMSCFTQDGYLGSSKGNIASAKAAEITGQLSDYAGAGAVLSYLKDPGLHNQPVGHRRWLLFPRLTEVGIGDTNSSNAIVVLGGKRLAKNDQWVMWPTPGYFPRQLEPQGRWSISFAQADFRKAQIVIKSEDGAVELQKHAIKNGFGDNTLSWEMKMPRKLIEDKADYRFEVQVNNIKLNGKLINKRYWVELIDI